MVLGGKGARGAPGVDQLPFRRGFCFFNSVAIAARQLQQKGKLSKILIVDWVSCSQHVPVPHQSIPALLPSWTWEQRNLLLGVWLWECGWKPLPRTRSGGREQGSTCF